MLSALDKLAFNTTQAARISWFFGQKLLAARVSRPIPLPEPLRGRPTPDRRRILADLRALIEQDWRNVEAGYYAPPTDGLGSPFEAVRQAVDFFADLSAVERRRHGARKERILSEVPPGGYPRYYLQKFHFQSDGYLSGASAERYDHQVEVLFGGGGAAMRRQALVPLKAVLAGRPAARLLDVGCGTGRFLREVKANYPRLDVTGLDLSPHYLAVARRELQPWSRARLVVGAAEAMPFADGYFDAITCIYLFHELPARVRRAVVGEIRRVLKPGGILIFVDSLQTGDEPDYDAMLDYFPVAFHEPYYASYLREDLDRLWSRGFTPGERFPAYFSKVLSYRRNC
ncbi:MAG TPA: methyltransferase domain-containing protein [Stellaceae bacterium]|nr:methyltransferase domain-containing protein [Stellaceae bacterium]HMD64717.1 methyltransferase domain-containing protein [Stellaceae bacterium]